MDEHVSLHNGNDQVVDQASHDPKNNDEHGGFHYPSGQHRLPLEQEDFDDEHGNSTDSDDEHQVIGSARTPWYGTTIILLSEVMGTGILSLPFAAKTLGWTTSMIAVPLFAFFACYSGWLLACVKREYPHITSFADASKELLGHRFGNFTGICMRVNWGATAIYYLIATADGIQDILGRNSSIGNCSYKRSIVAALLLLVPTQCRDFHAISKYLSAPSSLAIVTLLFIIIGNLFYNNHSGNNDFGKTTTTGPLPGTSPLDFLESLSAFVFAYQGQSIYLELMSEMKDARQFPRSCNFAYIVMCSMYGLTVVVAYGFRGIDTPEFLPDILPAGAARTMAGILVVMHITVSYVIACQPLHTWLHSTIFPKTFHGESLRGSLDWFFVTFGYIAFSFCVGNLIPFFADVQALIGSLFGAPTMFGWPVAFYFALYRRRTESWKSACEQMGWANAGICLLFLFVLTPLFCILGTTGAIQSIIEDAEQATKPFQCTS